MFTVQRLNTIQAHAHLAELSFLLIDAVNSGAAPGCARPMDMHCACEFWKEAFLAIGDHTRILLIARDGDQIAGSVQLELCAKPTGTHRTEVQSLLVLSSYRRKGVVTALMRTVENEARLHGRVGARTEAQAVRRIVRVQRDRFAQVTLQPISLPQPACERHLSV